MKKKKNPVYCIDGPLRGKTYKVKRKYVEFSLTTPGSMFYTAVFYRVEHQIGFNHAFVARYLGGIKRKKQ